MKGIIHTALLCEEHCAVVLLACDVEEGCELAEELLYV